jgi:DNA polymerase-4
LFGPPLKTADQIIKRIESELGLPSSGGVATHRVVAKIAATLAKPHGLIFVPDGTEKDFLAPLDVKMIPGVGPKTYQSLLQRNVKTIGDLLRQPELAERFLDLRHSSETPGHRDHSVGNETTLENPLKEIAAMEEVLWELVEEVGRRLRKDNQYARCLTIKIRYSNFQTITRSRTLEAPTCFDREIFAIVSDLLKKNIAKGRAVRLLGVSASALQSSGWQEPLLNRDMRKSLEKLYQGIDNLREKYGADTVSAATTRKRS